MEDLNGGGERDFCMRENCRYAESKHTHNRAVRHDYISCEDRKKCPFILCAHVYFTVSQITLFQTLFFVFCTGQMQAGNLH